MVQQEVEEEEWGRRKEKRIMRIRSTELPRRGILRKEVRLPPTLIFEVFALDILQGIKGILGVSRCAKSEKGTCRTERNLNKKEQMFVLLPEISVYARRQSWCQAHWSKLCIKITSFIADTTAIYTSCQVPSSVEEIIISTSPCGKRPSHANSGYCSYTPSPCSSSTRCGYLCFGPERRLLYGFGPGLRSDKKIFHERARAGTDFGTLYLPTAYYSSF